jgi:UDP-MurNAc hydroxylase
LYCAAPLRPPPTARIAAPASSGADDHKTTDHQMTNIEFLGHSGLAIRHNGHLLLCDPWMSPDGAYNASWFQYPAYPHEDLSALLEPDAVYISHEHLDHYDPWFLNQLPKSTPIITGKFHKRRCIRLLQDLGFDNVIPLVNFEEFEIESGFRMRVAIPSYNCPPHWFDSCAIIEAGDKKIFNLNDANLALPLEELREERFDVFLGQASPAIWYPITYTNYTEEEKVRLMGLRRESAIESFVTGAKAVEPKLAIPFAGPPCFFDENLVDVFTRDDSMFPSPLAAAARLEEESDIPTQVLKPGDKLHIEDNGCRLEPTPAYADFDYTRDRVAYVEKNKAEKQARVRRVLDAIPPAEPGLFDRVKAHLTPLIEKNPFFSARINIRVLFTVTGDHGGKWVIDFRDSAPGEIVYEWNGEDCPYRFEFESRNIEQVLRGELSWEDLLLSLRFTAHRDPDRYNQHLFTFLKMADHAALQAIAIAQLTSDEKPDDLVTLDHGDECYEIQRFCPHAGSDLTGAEIADGRVVCPGHHWHFSLKDGRCEESEYKIYCRKLGGRHRNAS